MKQEVLNIFLEVMKSEFREYIDLEPEYICNNYTSIIDSLVNIKFVIKLENEFEIEFDDDKLSLDSFSNLEQVTDYIQAKIEKNK